VLLKDSDPAHDDEVSRLAREFNLMADALQERERRLVASERLAAVGQLVAQVTHEIRNPLSSVALNFELLQDEFTSSEGDAHKIIQSIGTELERLSQITETYLDFARRPQPSRHPTELREEIEDLATFLRLEFDQAGVALELQDGAEACWAAVDPDQIRRVLINLLRNAREAAAGLERVEQSQSPRVWIDIRTRGRQIEIDVGDTGGGLPPGLTDTAQIFDAFFTLKAKGTGLGLAVVRQVVEAHGGGVEVAQTGPEGTIFRVTLPACDP
jgi:signal transduction histidine kinase